MVYGYILTLNEIEFFPSEVGSLKQRSTAALEGFLCNIDMLNFSFIGYGDDRTTSHFPFHGL